MLFPNCRIGDVLQIQDGFRLNQIEIDIRRMPSLYVVLPHLALRPGLVHRIIGMTPVHQHLKYQNRESEQVVLRCPVYVLESQPHESGGSEIFLSDCAAM